jgi:DNA replication and repair protein RecF
MHIKDIKLVNFRNYGDTRIDIKNGVNFILGHNAAGKTNLLEAIYYLENSRSHRAGSISEIIRWDCDFSYVRASINRNDREIVLESSIKKSGTRQLKINGVLQTPQQAKYKPVVTVLFTPDHLKIVKETPDHRRAYLDEILERIKPDYQYWRQQYSKILKQRNILLKRVFGGGMKKDVIDYWDVQLIQAGIKLIKARSEIIQRLQESTNEAYRKISQRNDRLTLIYENQILNEGEEHLTEQYVDLLKKNRSQEIERGQTIIGPHRDDMIIKIGDMDVRAYGSQGEQRSVSLALKVSEMSLIASVLCDKPVLLLDDVMSELDEVRRQSLLEYVSEGQQVIITSANEKYAEDMRDLPVNIIRVNNGKIE